MIVVIVHILQALIQIGDISWPRQRGVSGLHGLVQNNLGNDKPKLSWLSVDFKSLSQLVIESGSFERYGQSHNGAEEITIGLITVVNGQIEGYTKAQNAGR